MHVKLPAAEESSHAQAPLPHETAPKPPALVQYKGRWLSAPAFVNSSANSLLTWRGVSFPPEGAIKYSFIHPARSNQTGLRA